MFNKPVFMSIHRLASLIFAAVFAISAFPQSPDEVSAPATGSRSMATKVSPYYYGPNAFPIPDILDRTSPDLLVRLAADDYIGRRGDNTADAEIKVSVPLWTRRANLSLWWVVREWFRNTDLNMETSGIVPGEWEFARSGSCGGDIYVSADLQILEEKKYRPDLTLRATLKTASGGHSHHRRFYDSAGYFFDAAAAKTIPLSSDWSLRFAVSAGFLCWQTDNGRQNDAFLFGIRAGARFRNWSLSETFGGYSGWESGACIDGHLAHDKPMSLKTVLQYSVGKFDIIAQYQYGLDDYPYQQLRLALAYHIPLKFH